MKKKKIIVSLIFCFLLVTSIFLNNKSEAKAAGNYTLQVNKGTNVVTVFRSDGTPERAFVCSTGYATPIGTFNTSQKLRWHVLDGPSYGQYCTRITGSVLFHSVWYYINGDYASQSYREYNKLGTTASHGCVRLTVADAKWIYDNCPLGTTVNVIYGSSANDPLGKPVAIKVPDVKMGWDPTDPMTGNPYSSAMPSIDTSGAVTQVSYGSQFNPVAGIVARDSLGNDISGNLAYAGTVDTNRLGSYQITYRVTDALGRTAYADVVYTVVDTQKAVIKGVKKSLTKEYNSTLNLKKNVKAYTVTGKNLTKKIKIKVIYPGSKKEKTYKKNTLKLNKLGTYKINYYVTNPDNKLVTKATCKVKVRDTKKPRLTGVVSKKTIEYNTTRNLRSGVKAKLVSGKNMTSKIVVKMRMPGKKKYTKLSMNSSKKYKFKKIGTYRVEYSVANPYNKKAVAKKVTTITVKDTKKPNISGVASKKTVEYNSTLNLKSGVTAKLVSGKSMTSKIVIKVKVPGMSKYVILKEAAYKKYKFSKTGTYTVEYSVTNPYNKKAVAKKKMTVTVRDTKAPVISGVSDRNLEFGASLDLKKGITAKLVSGKDITASLKIVVTTPDNKQNTVTGQDYTFTQAGTYTVVYTAVNPTSNKSAQKTMRVVVAEDARIPQISIDNSKQAEVETGTAYDVFAGVAAALPGQTVAEVSAVITGVDESGQPIEAIPEIAEGKVTFDVAGTYTITFTAVNPNNTSVIGTAEFTLKVTVPKSEEIEDTVQQQDNTDADVPEVNVIDEPEQQDDTGEDDVISPQSEPEEEDEDTAMQSQPEDQGE